MLNKIIYSLCVLTVFSMQLMATENYSDLEKYNSYKNECEKLTNNLKKNKGTIISFSSKLSNRLMLIKQINHLAKKDQLQMPIGLVFMKI